MKTLGEALVCALEKYTDQPALVFDDRQLNYADLGSISASIAQAILNHSEPKSEYIGILGVRSLSAYAGIVGCLLAGKAYMPLNPRFPVARLAHMIRSSECRLVIAGEECAPTLREVLREVKGLAVLCPSPGNSMRTLASERPRNEFCLLGNGPVAPLRLYGEADPDTPAYLMFTSGTTGTPKGIAITHSNVMSYLRYTIDRYGVAPGDRLSQMFDLTFDLSVHDIFVTFLSGAALHVPPATAIMAPAKFIKDRHLTMWFSVPSVPMFMSRMRMLKPGAFPSLRFSLFCGEALPVRTAEAWQAAAPNSAVENLYGPTEATIAITNYRWDPERSPAESVNGVVPIGWPFDGHRVRIIDPVGRTLGENEEGELCLAGPQIAPGYLKDPVRTAERFVRFEDDAHTVWYRTGDLAKRNKDGCLFYLGRIDDQVQVRGFRVELQEIDHAIRQGAGTDLAIAIPVSSHDGQIEKIVAVVQGVEDDFVTQEVLAACKTRLPDYMVPAEVRFVKSLPLNANGKIDRKALMELTDGHP